ncbi:hypothetical protein FRC03_012805 [Tulasnella sp. 419]|nr:hypothetical protein FRC03_012805 [Tulasnella sp. 419]
MFQSFFTTSESETNGNGTTLWDPPGPPGPTNTRCFHYVWDSIRSPDELFYWPLFDLLGAQPPPRVKSWEAHLTILNVAVYSLHRTDHEYGSGSSFKRCTLPLHSNP